jgi:hypothetical protein
LTADGGKFGIVGVAQVKAQETLNSLLVEQIKLKSQSFSTPSNSPVAIEKEKKKTS